MFVSSSLTKMDGNINVVTCNLIGVIRRCFFTRSVAEENPGSNWRYDEKFKDFTSDSEEEVLYEQKNRGMNKVNRERKMSMEIRETDVSVIPKETTLLLHEGKLKEEKEEKDTILILNEIDEALNEKKNFCSENKK